MTSSPNSVDQDRTEMLEKYREIRKIREVAQEGDTRLLMRELALRFPGSLRELDQLAPLALNERIEKLEAREFPEWAAFGAYYHRWLRALLCIRYRCRPLPEERRPTVCAQILEAESLLGHLSTEVALETALSPPEGRLNPWVFSMVAQRFETDADRVESVVFPPRNTPK